MVMKTQTLYLVHICHQGDLEISRKEEGEEDQGGSQSLLSASRILIVTFSATDICNLVGYYDVSNKF